MAAAMSTRVSLTELTEAGVRLKPAEAAAIVAEICSQRHDGRLRGVPSANVIRLTQDGDVVAEGPVNTDGPAVAHAAQLLDDLLPGFDAPPEFRAPGGLRLAIARALGTLDVPAFATLDEFVAAIARFAAPDVRAAARDLFAAWAAATPETPVPASVPATVEPLPDPTLTISDVRRARRATGLTLEEVSHRSRIPAPLLRQLEWGYLRNWPGGLYGRSQLVRYARAAGLDEQLVVEIAWPLLDAMIAERGAQHVTQVVPAERPIDALVPITAPALPMVAVQATEGSLLFRPAAERSNPPAQSVRARHRGLRRAVAAVAATVAVALAPAAWEQFHRPSPSDERVEQGVVDSKPIRSRGVAPAGAPSHRMPEQARGRQTVPDGALPAAKTAEPPSAVTAQPAAYSPTFSNTGTAMFFHEESGGTSALMRADTDERGTVLKITRIVDDNAQNFHARPSPDGARIAFDSDREGTRAVFVADSDGQHVRRISGDGFAAVPSWSPDGQRLAFVKAESDKPRVWNIWTTDLGSGELQRVTSSPHGQPWGASWFPDGDRIAYSHEEELVVLNLKTNARQVFKTPVAGHLLRTPAVSPDGRRVIFQVYHDGAWLLDLRNASMRRVLDDPSAEEYTWSPDGHRVAFHSHRAGGWGVWVMGQ
jgi:Tol biopolymer transport system component